MPHDKQSKQPTHDKIFENLNKNDQNTSAYFFNEDSAEKLKEMMKEPITPKNSLNITFHYDQWIQLTRGDDQITFITSDKGDISSQLRRIADVLERDTND